MTSILNVTTELSGDHYLVTAEVQAGGTLPQEIFIYTNDGSSALGEFFGTCNINELGRLQVFTGTPIPIFGNRYYRYHSAKIKIDLADDPTAVVSALVKNVTSLSKALKTKTTVSTNYTIS